MPWTFRLRCDLGATSRLSLEEPAWRLSEQPAVVLKPADGSDTLSQAARLQVVGGPYPSEQAARQAGERWRDQLTRALATLNIGADFGDRTAGGGFTQAGLAAFYPLENVTVLNDAHGLMVYEAEGEVRFARVGAASGQARSSRERSGEALANKSVASPLPPAARLAYDLYAASFSESNEDARFLLLMMAIETLLEVRRRAGQSLQLVENWLLQACQLPPGPERDSLLGSLRHLSSESISSAGRRLARSLGDATFQNESAETFFRNCYGLRSRLVHGASPRPSTGEVGMRAASLEHFVAQLISRQ